jgi:hypothetical protein
MKCTEILILKIRLALPIIAPDEGKSFAVAELQLGDNPKFLNRGGEFRHRWIPYLVVQLIQAFVLDIGRETDVVRRRAFVATLAARPSTNSAPRRLSIQHRLN